jgi:hypothetical protein
VGQTGTIVLANCEDLFQGSFEELLGKYFKEILYISALEEAALSDEIIEAVYKAEAIIGRRGYTVYAGSCLKKPVLEFIEEDDDFSLLTQWSNPHYVPMIRDSNFSIERGVNRLWETVTGHRVSLIGTEAGTSIVGSADVL